MAYGANIRAREKECLRNLLLPGYIVQVSGPPMIGKLTMVNQVLSRLSPGLFIHHFPCKDARTIADVDSVMRCQSRLLNTPQLFDCLLPIRYENYHIYVFEKCESLVSEGNDYDFIRFLKSLIRPNITIVFTSYKRFEWPGSQPGNRDGQLLIGPLLDDSGITCSTLEMGPLDDEDILAVLHHFAPCVDPNPYLQVFQHHLGFPDVVRKVAETFLNVGVDGTGEISTEMLTRRIKSDIGFLHGVFGARMSEVIEWVGSQNLLLLSHIGSAIDSSSSTECFHSVATGGGDPFLYHSLAYILKRFYVIRELPVSGRLVVHPLVVHFCRTQLRQEMVAFRDASLFSKRFAQFLCRTLSTLDACRQLKGQQLQFVVSVLNETPNIRHVIEDALHANGDNYDTYFTLAVQGSRMLLHICPREVTQLFSFLHGCSVSEKRSGVEQAVLLGLYGQALARGTSESEEAQEKLRAAIDVLSRPGVPVSYYLLLFLVEMARVQTRLCLYEESLRYFRKARGIAEQVQTTAFGGRLAVTESKLYEANLHLGLHETVPLIFIGKNCRARASLYRIKDQLLQHFPCSLEVATVDNQLGLTAQRGFQNLQEAITLYSNSYRIRSYFCRINPIPMYAPLNNVAMLCFYREDFGQFYRHLQMALQISKDHTWNNYYTGLSLIHLAEGSIPLGCFESALVYLKEAERILAITAPAHDLRLRAFLELAHVRVALSHFGREYLLKHRFSTSEYQPLQQQSPVRHASGSRDLQNGGFMSCRCIPEDGELVSAARDMCDRVNPCDLALTPRDHLDRVVDMIMESSGTLSDDGHHYLLSSYEHALLLHWDCPTRFTEFRDKIFEHVARNAFIGRLFMQDSPKEYINLCKHKPMYLYLKQCANNLEEVNLTHFLTLMLPTCTVCKSSQVHGLKRNFFSTDLWCSEVNRAKVGRRQQNNGSVPGEQLRSSVAENQCRVPEEAPRLRSRQRVNKLQQTEVKQIEDSGEFMKGGESDTYSANGQVADNVHKNGREASCSIVGKEDDTFPALSPTDEESRGHQSCGDHLPSDHFMPNFDLLLSAENSQTVDSRDDHPKSSLQPKAFFKSNNRDSSLGDKPCPRVGQQGPSCSENNCQTFNNGGSSADDNLRPQDSQSSSSCSGKGIKNLRQCNCDISQNPATYNFNVGQFNFLSSDNEDINNNCSCSGTGNGISPAVLAARVSRRNGGTRAVIVHHLETGDPCLLTCADTVSSQRSRLCVDRQSLKLDEEFNKLTLAEDGTETNSESDAPNPSIVRFSEGSESDRSYDRSLGYSSEHGQYSNNNYILPLNDNEQLSHDHRTNYFHSISSNITSNSVDLAKSRDFSERDARKEEWIMHLTKHVVGPPSDIDHEVA